MVTTRLRKPYLGIQMEGPIATWYARTTRERRDLSAIAQTVASNLPAGGAVLEVAPGPGYLAIDLARRGPYRVTGLDISRTFIRIAADNARRAAVDVDWRHGDVAAMPFADKSFDFVVCVAAFKNFPEPVVALDEMYRVLLPGGQTLIVDMRKDAPLEDIDGEVRRMQLRQPATTLMRLIFRHVLLRAAYTRSRLESVVAASRFGHGEIVPDGIGFQLRLRRRLA